MSDIVQSLRAYAQCADAFGFPDDAHISVRAADEIERLRAAARKVTCATCAGTGGVWDEDFEIFDTAKSCPSCADLRALLT